MLVENQWRTTPWNKTRNGDVLIGESKKAFLQRERIKEPKPHLGRIPRGMCRTAFLAAFRGGNQSPNYMQVVEGNLILPKKSEKSTAYLEL